MALHSAPTAGPHSKEVPRRSQFRLPAGDDSCFWAFPLEPLSHSDPSRSMGDALQLAAPLSHPVCGDPGHGNAILTLTGDDRRGTNMAISRSGGFVGAEKVTFSIIHRTVKPRLLAPSAVACTWMRPLNHLVSTMSKPTSRLRQPETLGPETTYCEDLLCSPPDMAGALPSRNGTLTAGSRVSHRT